MVFLPAKKHIGFDYTSFPLHFANNIATFILIKNMIE